MRGSFLFDPESHTYWADGEKVLSVTQILKNAGLIDDTWYTENGRDKGTYVHKLTESLDNGTLNSDTVNPSLAGYLTAYMRFKKDTDIKIKEIEYTSFNPVYRFAGTLDRIVIIGGSPAVLDIKAGKKAHWHPLQTAGYNMLIGEAMQRFCLYLSSNGNYRLDFHRNYQDHDVFVSALTIANWKAQNCNSGL